MCSLNRREISLKISRLFLYTRIFYNRQFYERNCASVLEKRTCEYISRLFITEELSNSVLHIKLKTIIESIYTSIVRKRSPTIWN